MLTKSKMTDVLFDILLLFWYIFPIKTFNTSYESGEFIINSGFLHDFLNLKISFVKM